MWAPRGRKKQLPGLSSWKKKSSWSCREGGREEGREGGRERGREGEGGREGRKGGREGGKRGKEVKERREKMKVTYSSDLPVISLGSFFLKVFPLFQL